MKVQKYFIGGILACTVFESVTENSNVVKGLDKVLSIKYV